MAWGWGAGLGCGCHLSHPPGLGRGTWDIGRVKEERWQEGWCRETHGVHGAPRPGLAGELLRVGLSTRPAPTSPGSGPVGVRGRVDRAPGPVPLPGEGPVPSLAHPRVRPLAGTCSWIHLPSSVPGRVGALECRRPPHRGEGTGRGWGGARRRVSPFGAQADGGSERVSAQFWGVTRGQREARAPAWLLGSEVPAPRGRARSGPEGRPSAGVPGCPSPQTGRRFRPVLDPLNQKVPQNQAPRGVGMDGPGEVRAGEGTGCHGAPRPLRAHDRSTRPRPRGSSPFGPSAVSLGRAGTDSVDTGSQSLQGGGPGKDGGP